MSQKLKLFSITVIIFSLMLCMLIMPSVCIEGATFGLLLWFNKLLPTLLPFIILTQMLCSLGIVFQASRLISPITHKFLGLDGTSFLIFIMGLIAGYPTGAKITKQLLDQHQLSKPEAQKCLLFVNNCGPLFIIGTVGSILLQNVTLGYFLAFIHIFSAFTMLLLSRFFKLPKQTSRHSVTLKQNPPSTFITVFNQAVQGGMDTIVYVGGYIIFFSVISNILKHLSGFRIAIHHLSSLLHISTTFLSSFIYGCIEFSSGIAMVCQTNTLTPTTLALISFILTFGGFCVFFQSSYVLQGTSLKLGPLLISKLFQGLIAYLYTLLFSPLFFSTSFSFASPYTLKLLGILLLLLGAIILLFKTASTFTTPPYNLEKR